MSDKWVVHSDNETVVVTHPRIGGYVATENSENIASTILYHYADWADKEITALWERVRVLEANKYHYLSLMRDIRGGMSPSDLVKVIGNTHTTPDTGGEG